jgi:hypothetical protein
MEKFQLVRESLWQGRWSGGFADAYLGMSVQSDYLSSLIISLILLCFSSKLD